MVRVGDSEVSNGGRVMVGEGGDGEVSDGAWG